MKTSKIILALFIAQILCLFVPQVIFCQTEKLDTIEYTPPKGWTKTPKQGAVVYTVIDKTTNAFCVLTIYGEGVSAGNPKQDFADQWKLRVIDTFKVAPNPETETKAGLNGLQGTVGGTEIEFGGVKAVAILTVFTGFGKTASVLTIFTDKTYLEQMQTFVDGIKLDKTRMASVPPRTGTQNVPSTADYLDFDPFPDRPYVQAQEPLLGRLKKTITLADLAGKWQIGGANVTSYFNSSGNYSSTDTTFFGEWYTIRANGTFDSQFQGRTSNHTVRESDSGTIVLDGGTVTFKFKQKAAMRYQFVAYMDAPKGGAVLSLIHIGDNALMGAESLRASCGHAHGWVTCVTGEEFVRIP
jgi:hypothetical protein